MSIQLCRSVAPSLAGRFLLTSSVLLALSVATIAAAGTMDTQVPMDGHIWQTTRGNVTYNAKDDYIDLGRSSTADLKSETFGSGTIEFDMKSAGGIMGVTFHQQGKTGDALYFRPSADCVTSDECIQYMRMDHGIFEWEMFGDNQTHAPFHPDSWNHVKMVVNGRQMSVWINGEHLSVPVDGALVGAYDEGGITLHGPATYAHFTIRPEGGPMARHQVQPGSAIDPHFVRYWKISRALVMPSVFDHALGENTGVSPVLRSMPAQNMYWRELRAMQSGLVNVTDALGDDQKGDHIVSAWLKTTVLSDRNQIKHVSIGWSREVWVFVNGKLVFADKNLYGIPSASKKPDGRLSLENGAFDLPLAKGRNDVVVMLDDNMGGGEQHFGWGLMLRLADMDGVILPKAVGTETTGGNATSDQVTKPYTLAPKSPRDNRTASPIPSSTPQR